MPKFITSIRLQAATENDYAKLSQELEKKSFLPVRKPSLRKADLTRFLTFKSSNKKSLLDATEAVSNAAATTGKKYSFTVIKDKVIA
jgi:hypothetical protein